LYQKKIVPVEAIFYKRSQNGKTNEAKKVYYFLQAFIRKKKDIVPVYIFRHLHTLHF